MLNCTTVANAFSYRLFTSPTSLMMTESTYVGWGKCYCFL